VGYYEKEAFREIIVKSRQRYSNQGQLSGSESMLSLAAPIPPRGGVSPIPPASAIDTKYSDSKLHPLPGIVGLQRDKGHKRPRGMSLSASTPDVTTIALAGERPHDLILTPQHEQRRLSTQASDSRLQMRYQQQNASSSNVPKSATNFNGIDYFAVGPSIEPRTPPSKNNKLPMDRQGVRHWLKKFVPTQGAASPSGERKPPTKKLSLSDVLSTNRRDIDSGTDWEEITNPGTPSVYGKEIHSHLRSPLPFKTEPRPSPNEAQAPPSILRTPSNRAIPLTSRYVLRCSRNRRANLLHLAV
jgi:hypothetical protein